MATVVYVAIRIVHGPDVSPETLGKMVVSTLENQSGDWWNYYVSSVLLHEVIEEGRARGKP